MFGDYLDRWELTPDGAPIIAHSSRLLPVRRNGDPAMLKVALHPEGKLGGRLMGWWDGRGAGRVLAHDDDALLIERACEGTSLADLARSGHDDQATRIICAAITRLHAIGAMPPLDLVPLAEWFEPLPSMAHSHGGVLHDSALAASELSRFMAISTMRTCWILGREGGLSSIPRASSANAVTTTPIYSATPTRGRPRRPVVWADSWRSSPPQQIWIAGGCCKGSWRGPACRRCGRSNSSCLRAVIFEWLRLRPRHCVVEASV
jgi:hypothetical protein